MKMKRLNLSAALLSCLGMLVSPVAAATPATAPRDVALHEGGVLLGQVVDAQGGSVAGAPVSLYSGGKEVARTESDVAGKFAVSGLQGGVYQVASAQGQDVYRLWNAQTAPPAAQRGMMLVSNPDIVRGQGPFGGIANWVSQHPIITAGAVAAAIAIPLALDDDDPPATP
ncbi:MAG: carboxypeptidase regulatory-like domain-containing protein [Planctomycetales bacterium]|nr:carboxypeptidase regulatory-like domain-containing protein [Planctomycetales bacterium]